MKNKDEKAFIDELRGRNVNDLARIVNRGTKGGMSSLPREGNTDATAD